MPDKSGALTLAGEVAILRAKVIELAARALPDPKAGCACHDHGGDPLSGPPDVEYEPACPIHSVHVYDPRRGMWIFATDLRTDVGADGYGSA